MDEEPETYTVQEAARVLKRTPEAIGQMLRSGELSGEHVDGDEHKPWRVYKWSAHVLHDRLREDRPATDRPPPSRSPQGATGARGFASELFRVQDLQRELRRLEHRLELSERTESALREELVRERRRREEAERERDDLRRELCALGRESEAHEAAEEQQGRGRRPQSAAGGAQEGSRRPWWGSGGRRGDPELAGGVIQSAS